MECKTSDESYVRKIRSEISRGTRVQIASSVGFVPKVATKRFVNSAACKEKLLFKEKNKKYVGTKIRQGFIVIEQDESIFIADAIVQKKYESSI